MKKNIGVLLVVIVLFSGLLAACGVSPEAVQTVAPAVSEVSNQLQTSVSTQMAGPVGTQVVQAATDIGTQAAALATRESTQIAAIVTQLATVTNSGEALVNTVCIACHPADTINTLKNDEENWRKFVVNHEGMGNLPAEQLDLIVKYLAEKYGR